MFTSFSGSTRRPRQVNLGGRKSHAFGNAGPGAGSQAALDRAQQDRVQRQRERESLKAAQLIQRVWRGHESRTKLADKLRQDWDAAEASAQTPGPYASEEEASGQLMRLVQFASSHNHEDADRIRRFASRQMQTVRELGLAVGGPWQSAYLKLEAIVLNIVERQLPTPSSLDTIREHLVILRFLADQISAENSRDVQRYYRTLARVASQTAFDDGVEGNKALVDSLFQATLTPLTKVSSHVLKSYEAFAYSFLPLPSLTTDGNSALASKFRDSLADSINYKLLANALASSLKETDLKSNPALADSADRLRLLGLFIYLHRFAHNFHSPEAYSVHKDFVTVVSLLLNSFPANVIEGPGSDDRVRDVEEEQVVNEFLRDQILSLVNQEGIGNLLSGSSQSPEATEDEKVEEARQLANYALALLRFFPRRGDEIRMWLYIGPSESRADKGPSRKLPAIKYFWEASKRSSIFATISQNSRAAIHLLRPKSTGANDSTAWSQQPAWQAPQQEIDREAVTADEWRVILVFLELYTFVLKITDDEEFFASGRDTHSGEVRDNSLPLAEVKDLTTFLKNLGFTLYYNASDINAPEERDVSSTGLSFFSHRAFEPQAQKQTEPSVGGVAGLSLDYVKGLVTGLVRMIYERDSRRKFLPADQWLMSSRLDMKGFIPAVVEEEESRHKIQEEDAEDNIGEEEEEDFDDTPQLIGTGRAQTQRRLERLQRQQRKASRRRYLQAVAPRLEILQNMPFFISFTTRVQIFREFVLLDMVKRRGSADPEMWRVRVMQRADAATQFSKHSARIRREHEFDDAFAQFYELGPALKEPIQITFVDQFDQQEAGIDGGGVTKEFLTSVTSRAFMPADGIDMFVENDQHLLYPNPVAVEELKERLRRVGLPEHSPEFRLQISEFLQRYEFLGRIIGKCMYEGILVDVNFAPFFLRKWALTGGTGSAPNESGYRPSLNDLRDLDEGLYQGLHQLKNYTGDVEDFALNFTVTDTITVDPVSKKTKAITKDLKADGANTPVTNQNRLVYISYMARHRLQNQPYLQTAAFLRGLSSMIQPSWLSMFNQAELQTLVGGASTSIDIDDLRRNTIYGGVYVIGDDGLEHPTVTHFWNTMISLSDTERRAVLKFVTSTPRAPLLGFGTLNPRFSIRDSGNDQERLPSTSTCVNLLKLPMYATEKVLREKLLYSVNSGAGFDLS